MTETREISRDTYRKISRKAGKLFDLISEAMTTIGTTGEWDDLHSFMELAHIISRTASRYADQAPGSDAHLSAWIGEHSYAASLDPDPDAPVPYVPAEGMRDLQAAARLAARDGWTTT